jgi:hypothetical protein
MNLSHSQLEARREQILEQIQAIDRLRRGSLSRQFFKKRRADSKTPQGPMSLSIIEPGLLSKIEPPAPAVVAGFSFPVVGREGKGGLWS